MMNAAANLHEVYRNQVESELEAIARKGQEIAETASRTVGGSLPQAVCESVPQAVSESAPQAAGASISHAVEDINTSTSQSGDTVTDRLMNIVSDTNDVHTPRNSMVEIYAWSSVCAFAAMVGMFLGHSALAPFVESVVEENTAMITACIVLPSIAIFVIQQYDEDVRYHNPLKDGDVRFVSLSFSFVQGIFVGRAIRSVYLSAQPPLFITPAAIAVCYGNMPRAAGNNRIALLSCSMSTALVANFIFGSVCNILTSSFIALTFCYVIASGVVMQFIFGNVNNKSAIHTYQHALVTVLIAVKGCFFLTFGAHVYM